MNTSNEGRNVKMFFRILKKDLKRKKVMNAILLCFILLATMFVASGISNVVSVMNGTNSYLDKAGIGDYVVISMGADSKASIDEILHEMESIRDYRIEPVVLGEKSNLKDMHGEKLEAKNSVIYQSIEDSRLKFFDKENKQITQIKPGHAYATGDFIAFLDSDDYIEKNAYEEIYIVYYAINDAGSLFGQESFCHRKRPDNYSDR